MSQPWFDANLYAWLPGTVLGCLGGLWGALAGILAPQGKGKKLIFGSLGFLTLSSVVLLGAGMVALFTGQPYGIWYGLGFPGFLGSILLGSVSPLIVLRYRQAEERRMRAQDLG